MTATKDVVGYQWKSARKTRLLTYELSNSGESAQAIFLFIGTYRRTLASPLLPARPSVLEHHCYQVSGFSAFSKSGASQLL